MAASSSARSGPAARSRRRLRVRARPSRVRARPSRVRACLRLSAYLQGMGYEREGMGYERPQAYLQGMGGAIAVRAPPSPAGMGYLF